MNLVIKYEIMDYNNLDKRHIRKWYITIIMN